MNSPALKQENSGWVWSVNTNTSYKLPKEYTLQAYGNINSPWFSLQRRSKTLNYYYSLSAKKTFWKQKGALTFGTNNPFTTRMRQANNEQGQFFISSAESFYINRSFRLTFEWRFGQMTAGGRQGKKISNDDAGGR
jgi:hypothetical protein